MFVINGVTWNIQFVNPNDSILQRSDGSYTVAVTDARTQTVYLSNKLNGRFLKKVLCHELVHCLIFSLGIEIDLFQEEYLADFLATYSRDILHLVHELVDGGEM